MISGIYRPWVESIVNTHLLIVDRWVSLIRMATKKNGFLPSLPVCLFGDQICGDSQTVHVLSPGSFETSKWMFSTSGTVCNLELCQEWKEGGSVKQELELQEPLPRNPGCLLSFLWFAEVRVCRKLPYAQESMLFPLGPSVLTAICTSARCESSSWGEEDVSPSASSRWKSLSS